MRKKSMITKCSIFILCLAMGMFFVSCSSDDSSGNSDSNNKAIVELPENLLATYTSGFVAGLPDRENLILGTATLIKTDEKTYTINFSENVDAITDIEFYAVDVESTFVYENTEKEISIVVSTPEGEPLLIVRVGVENDSTTSFTGSINGFDDSDGGE